MSDQEQKSQPVTEAKQTNSPNQYPLRFHVDYAEKVSRWSTLFRLLLVIPITIVFMTVAGGIAITADHESLVVGAGGVLFLGPLLMILFRKHYPKWWFNWNVELIGFLTRIHVYFYSLHDQYPSVEGNNSVVHLDIDYPKDEDLMRGMPLIKWLLLLPHYVVLIILGVFTVLVWIVGWICTLFIGRYPRSLFNYMVGYTRWWLRVFAYGYLLITDKYPPFRLSE